MLVVLMSLPYLVIIFSMVKFVQLWIGVLAWISCRNLLVLKDFSEKTWRSFLSGLGCCPSLTMLKSLLSISLGRGLQQPGPVEKAWPERGWEGHGVLLQ